MLRPSPQCISQPMRYWIATSLLALTSSVLSPAPVRGQQITATFSKGAPGSLFSRPTYIAFDAQGNLFVSDTNNHRVQRIDKQTGTVTTVVGTGTAGSSGDGGPATQAQVNCPQGLAFDVAGTLYVADRCQNVVRKVIPGADSLVTGAADEIITTFAGNGSVASCVLASGTASQTPINAPGALVTDQAGNLFMIAGQTLAGSCSQLIQRVGATSGFLTTVEIIGPSTVSPGMAFDDSGNLFTWAFQEEGVMCPPAALTQSADPFTGNPLCQSAFGTPSGFTGSFQPPGMTFDKAGNLFFSNDESACDGGCTAIFKLAPGASGTIAFDSIFSLYAGTELPGYSGDSGPPLNATFNTPVGLAFNSAGNLFIGDSRNNVIRAILNCAATPAGNGISVNPLDQNGTSRADVVVTFDSVSSAGCSAVIAGQPPAPLPAGFQLAGNPPVTFDIISSAQFTGNATVCITSNPLSPSAEILHFNQGTWDNVTVSVDSTTGTICGQASSLSPFAVAAPGQPGPILISHPSDPTDQTTATFFFSDSDPTIASFICTLDSTANPCDSGVRYPSLADGSHTFSVVGQTASGNLSSSTSFTWVVDTVAPPAPTISSHPSDPSSSGSPSFFFADTESGVAFMCSLDGTAASCTSPSIYSSLRSGSHSFSVTATDAAGNVSAPATFSWIVQLPPPPAPQIISAPQAISNQNPPTFSFTDSQVGVTFQCHVDAATFQACTSGISYTGLIDGNHTFSVEAVDASGGISAVTSDSWTMDTTPPLAPQIASKPTDPTNLTQATFTFVDGSGDVASYLCSIDGGGFAACASGVTFTVAQGTHTFSVDAKDSAGNIGPATSYTWNVDTTNPVVVFTSLPINPTNQNTTPISFAGQLPNLTFQCSLDAVQFIACTSPFRSTALADGTHTFQSKATNSAGVTGPTASYTWVVDTAPPPTPSLSGPQTPGQTRNVSFTFSDAEAGVTFLCSVDGGTLATCASPLPLTTPSLDAQHTFQVIASDAAGNRSTPASYSWIVYTTPPAAPTLTTYPVNPLGLPGGGPGINAIVGTNAATFIWSDTSLDIVRYFCIFDRRFGTNPAEVLCSSPLNLTNLNEGFHSLEVRAEDVFGQPSLYTTFGWIVDVTPPTAPTLQGVPANPTGIGSNRGVRFSVFSSDLGEGVAFYLCSLDGSPTSVCDPAFPSVGSFDSSQVLSEGNHTFTAQAVDVAGNLSAVSVFSWLVDLTPPVVTPPAPIVVVTKGAAGIASPADQPALHAFWNAATATDNFAANPMLYGTTVESTTPIDPTGSPRALSCPERARSTPESGLGFITQEQSVLAGDNCVGFAFRDDALSGPGGSFSNIGVGWTLVRAVPGVPTDSTNSTVVLVDPRSTTAPPANLSNVTVTFTGITTPGNTGVDITTTGPALPSGFKLGNPPQYYDIVTTAQYTAPVTVCIAASPLPVGSALLHFNQQTQQWEDFTIRPIPSKGPICANVNSLSPFAVVQPLNNPPTASAGSNQTIEATSAVGAAVTLSGSGSDPDSDPITFTWSETGSALGTGAQITVTLPIGVHNITLTADDSRGGITTSAVTITVQDTRPPVFTPPANQTLEATSSTGATATFSATATDIVDGTRPVICSPASGSTFPLATTTVACSTTDLHGNTSTGSFTITVRDTKPPVVTPPLNITVPATEAGGVRGAAWPALAAFLSGATAIDIADPAPLKLQPQIGGANVDSNTLIPYGTTAVSFRFRDASGNVGTATASVTVILGTVKLLAQVAAQGKNPDGTYFIDVKLSNDGTGNARKLRVDLVAALPTIGSGKIVVVSPAFPLTVGIGSLDAGASQTIHVVLKVPATVRQFALAEAGNFTNVKGTPDLFAINQKVAP